jgi:hypothetical protein
MRLAPLTARTFDAFKALGYQAPGLPQRVILIEHQGAIIAGAELVETHGARGVFLQGLQVASWVQVDVLLKACRAVFRAAANYAAIVGQPVTFVGLVEHPEQLPEGWTGNGMLWLHNPFAAAPERPVEAVQQKVEADPGDTREVIEHETGSASEEADVDEDEDDPIREIRSSRPKATEARPSSPPKRVVRRRQAAKRAPEP